MAWKPREVISVMSHEVAALRWLFGQRGKAHDRGLKGKAKADSENMAVVLFAKRSVHAVVRVLPAAKGHSVS